MTDTTPRQDIWRETWTKHIKKSLKSKKSDITYNLTLSPLTLLREAKEYETHKEKWYKLLAKVTLEVAVLLGSVQIVTLVLGFILYGIAPPPVWGFAVLLMIIVNLPIGVMVGRLQIRHMRNNQIINYAIMTKLSNEEYQ